MQRETYDAIEEPQLGKQACPAPNTKTRDHTHKRMPKR